MWALGSARNQAVRAARILKTDLLQAVDALVISSSRRTCNPQKCRATAVRQKMIKYATAVPMAGRRLATAIILIIFRFQLAIGTLTFQALRSCHRCSITSSRSCFQNAGTAARHANTRQGMPLPKANSFWPKTRSNQQSLNRSWADRHVGVFDFHKKRPTNSQSNSVKQSN